jgi:hypothetical protein
MGRAGWGFFRQAAGALGKYTAGFELDLNRTVFRGELFGSIRGRSGLSPRNNYYECTVALPGYTLPRASERCSESRIGLRHRSLEQRAIRESECNSEADPRGDIQLQACVEIELGARGRHHRICRI